MMKMLTTINLLNQKIGEGAHDGDQPPQAPTHLLLSSSSLLPCFSPAVRKTSICTCTTERLKQHHLLFLINGAEVPSYGI
jgi:hypothetical protein